MQVGIDQHCSVLISANIPVGLTWGFGWSVGVHLSIITDVTSTGHSRSAPPALSLLSISAGSVVPAAGPRFRPLMEQGWGQQKLLLVTSPIPVEAREAEMWSAGEALDDSCHVIFPEPLESHRASWPVLTANTSVD